MASTLQFQVESFLLLLQRDVRRWVWIVAGSSIVLLYPAILAGGFTSSAVRSSEVQFTDIVIPKNIEEQPYIISEVQTTDLDNGEKLLYVTVNNKQNIEIGFWPWTYSVKVLNAAGQVLEQRRIRSYLLPEEVKFITVTTAALSAESIQITEIPSETQAVIYNPQASDILQEADITLLQNDVSSNSATGTTDLFITLRNDDNIFVEELDVLYLIRDSRGAVIGAETTTVNGFAPGTTRDITASYPSAIGRSARTVEVRWDVNYLDSSQIRLP